jgi:acetyltransferase-like isoleucine patch superfamily enzyme
MRRMIARLEKSLRLGLGALRLARYRLQLSRASLPGRQSIGPRVRISVTDGGSLSLGPDCAVESGASLLAKTGTLRIGPSSFIGRDSVIAARESITIGRDCLIAEHATIRDQDHRFGPGLTTAQAGFTTAPIVIGNNVWIGAKATVTKGVTIGDNVVIGANSVVTRDIPANSVAVGAPARVIRNIGPSQ